MFGGQNAQFGVSKMGCKAPKVAFGHEVGFSDPSVPQKGVERKYAKNQNKLRWLGGPESRHTA